MRENEQHKNLQSGFWGISKNLAVPLGCGLVFLLLLKCVFFLGYVPSASMEPTIRKDSFIFGFRATSDLDMGDIVVFEYNNRLMVKRIAALTGDNVILHGKAQSIPDDSYYLLGDNPEESNDSRYWSEPFIPKTQIIAKVLLK